MVEDFQENYVTGWIKLFRSVKNHWLWSNGKKLTYFEAWILILIEVNHGKEKCLIDGEVLECDKGQKLYSIKTWAEMFNWSPQNVRTFFKLLQNDGMIKIKGMRKTTRLTVCNYDRYQNGQHTTNTHLTHSQHTTNTHLTTIEELKNDKNEKNDKKINIAFDEFWDLYDKKIGDKSKCKLKWNKLSDEARLKIINSLPEWKKQFSDKQYQPYPATYLNQKRWNDEIEQKQKQQKQVQLSYHGLGFLSKEEQERVKRGEISEKDMIEQKIKSLNK